jgi:Tetratricopeptide repeat/PEGA domain
MRRVLTLLVLVTLCGRGLAQPRDPREAARGKLVEGAGFLADGDYRNALARFQEAYALFPSPKLHYNLALAYLGLGRDADALKAFEAFLAAVPDAPPENRKNAELHVTELRRMVAFVALRCDVDGARVSLDGVTVGTTPLAGSFPVDPGPHQLVVQKADLPPHIEPVVAGKGQRLDLTVTLARRPVVPPDPPPEPNITHPILLTIEPAPSGWRRPAGWTAAVGAGLALAGGTTALVLRDQHWRRFNKHCHYDDDLNRIVDDNLADPSSCQVEARSADRARSLAVAGFATGAALGVAALFLLWPSSTPAPRHACVPTSPGPGFTCALRF